MKEKNSENKQSKRRTKKLPTISMDELWSIIAANPESNKGSQPQDCVNFDWEVLEAIYRRHVWDDGALEKAGNDATRVALLVYLAHIVTKKELLEATPDKFDAMRRESRQAELKQQDMAVTPAFSEFLETLPFHQAIANNEVWNAAVKWAREHPIET